ncbi:MULTISPECIES: FHA domain-containing protein [Rhodomicrobium]|uniref:FHA domain-containing protein n=1 Tax=Rhodomicrobium TaxID=1068 RepID=UPI000B4B1827|nr:MULTISPECIES: FHA domain-containing protein [Rhodomicrobium]
MADKPFDSEKTVVIRPAADGDRKTEAYRPHQTPQPGYGDPHPGVEATTVLSGNPGGYGATTPAGPPRQPHGGDASGPLRLTPQTPPGGAPTGGASYTQADAGAEAGYTRVLRPSVGAPAEPGAPSKAPAPPAGGALAAADLAILLKEGPVVGWLVVIGGPGKGLCRPVYYGNNTLGRDKGQRVPINFGDDAISAEEQAYIRYDSQERKYLLIPNLAKSNLVSVNESRPTERVVLSYGDVIGVGQTRLMFIPLCGPNFDWADVEAQ